MQQVQVDWRKHSHLLHLQKGQIQVTGSFQPDSLHRNQILDETQSQAVKV